MQAFWTVRPRDGDNPRRPAFPDVGNEEMYTVVPGDLGRATGPHMHLVIGSLGVPSTGQANHYHWFVRHDGGVAQVTIGAPDHSHTGDLAPDFYLVFVYCSDAAWAILDAAGVVQYGPASVTVEPDGSITIGPVDDTAWTNPQRNYVEGQLDTHLGLAMPDEVTNSRRFITWLLAMSLSRQLDDEATYRLTRA